MDATVLWLQQNIVALIAVLISAISLVISKRSADRTARMEREARKTEAIGQLRQVIGASREVRLEMQWLRKLEGTDVEGLPATLEEMEDEIRAAEKGLQNLTDDLETHDEISNKWGERLLRVSKEFEAILLFQRSMVERVRGELENRDSRTEGDQEA